MEKIAFQNGKFLASKKKKFFFFIYFYFFWFFIFNLIYFIFFSPKRFGGIMAIFLIIILNFLCGFFMINSLWIPPKCIFNIIRLLVWFLLANFGFREIYEEIKHSENKN
jgi:hypothetical protein